LLRWPRTRQPLAVTEMGTLFDALVPELRSRFHGRGLRLDPGPPQHATFPATHPEVGDLIIYDEDDEELIVEYGNFTHCHYGPHYGPFQDPAATPSGAPLAPLLSDLEDLFADRLMMWGSHTASGGILRVGEEPNWLLPPYDPFYVWSGPL